MANRTARRAAGERTQGRVTPKAIKPTGQHGVEITPDDKGVQLTFYNGACTFSIYLLADDARHVIKMVDDALANDVTPIEVVRGSGLVVPGGPSGFGPKL